MMLLPKIHFGIKIATFNREDGKTPELFHKTIKSLLNQSYENWTAYIVGDDYLPNGEFEELVRLVPKEKIKYENVNLNPERKNFPKNLYHYCGGTNATNYALDWMYKEKIKYLAILDHDDIWHPDHLMTLKEGYQKFPDADFIYTKGTHHLLGEVPAKKTKIGYNNFPPQPNNVLHSSVSWRLDKIPLRYVNTVEINKYDIHGNLYYGDAYMWELFQEYFRKNKYNFLFIPVNTISHIGI